MKLEERDLDEEKEDKRGIKNIEVSLKVNVEEPSARMMLHLPWLVNSL